MKKFLSLRSAGVIAEIEGLKGPSEDEKDEDEDDDKVLDYIESGSERAKQGIEYAKQTLSSMYLAFFMLSGAFLLIGMLVFKDRLKYSAGIAMGVATGCYFIRSLNISVREVLNVGDKQAEKTMKKDGRLRLLVVGAGAGLVSAVVGGSAVYGALAQIFSLKLCAYLTPLVMKVRYKQKNDSDGQDLSE